MTILWAVSPGIAGMQLEDKRFGMYISTIKMMQYRKCVKISAIIIGRCNTYTPVIHYRLRCYTTSLLLRPGTVPS